MKITAEPRSDQWNADDFIGGPRTFTIAGVKDGAAEQKYDISLVEGEGRVWRPPLTMLRVLVYAWGDEAADWEGRRVTLYVDPTVRFGAEVRGGIRISHLSHIDKQLKVPISPSRGKRAIFKVEPLVGASPSPAQPAAPIIPDEVKANTEKAKQAGNLSDYIAWLAEQGAPEYILNYAKEQQ
ncbi:hypothetical protein [Arthrobacter sp. Z1-15]